MQMDELPTEPFGARSPTRSFGYVKLTLSGIPASEGPERKKKRRKREDASEDRSSKRERKRRKTEQHVPETPTTARPPSSSISTSTAVSEPSASEVEEYLQSNSITLTTAKGGPSIKPVLSFGQLQIPAELKTALSGFQNPTPIQACSWPPALQGQDVVGIAETGRYDDISVLTYPGLRMSRYQRENAGVWHPSHLTSHRVTKIQGNQSPRHVPYARTRYPNTGNPFRPWETTRNRECCCIRWPGQGSTN